jgi:hypothetical protein
VAEVAGRFIDEALQRYVEQPKLSISDVPKRKKGRAK